MPESFARFQALSNEPKSMRIGLLGLGHYSLCEFAKVQLLFCMKFYSNGHTSKSTEAIGTNEVSKYIN